MTTLLTVETVTDGRSKVRAYADAILYLPPQSARHGGYSTARYTLPSRVFAMSLIGPEQSIRAIGAGCSVQPEYQRTEIEFRGTNKVIKGRWAWRWGCRAVRLAGSMLHMVAMPEVTIAQDVSGKEPQHVIIAEPATPGAATTELDLSRAVYQRLMLCYSTPLIPLDLPGQPEHERAAAQTWCRVLVEQVMADTSLWQQLRSHPDQTDKTWEHAGVLTMSQNHLDDLVGELMRKRMIKIPEAA